ncbi:hypothetical protein NUW54_g3063 [Trametes sanguinea]|uniref:Uncharacterized protein n=1 Tax=Trametes sanguinea TaxID=158606 RepID=A0ACC1Q3G4_9APHY|nr:hypothetical protein NUW54_g3063 [Trametes sanguinea]
MMRLPPGKASPDCLEKPASPRILLMLFRPRTDSPYSRLRVRGHMPRASRSRDALGACYATRHGRERGMLRVVITDGLVEITGDPSGKMYWTMEGFCQFIFLAYGVKLVGWLPHIRFTNLSNCSTKDIQALLEAWEQRRMRWERATAAEIAAAREHPRNACPGHRFPDPLARGGRNDIGKHRKRPTIDSTRFPPRYIRDGPKSQRYIDSDEEAEAIEDASIWDPPRRPAGLARGELAEDPIESFSDAE